MLLVDFTLLTFASIINQTTIVMKAIKFSPMILALIKWSGIAITDGRNKVGGSVLTKTRAGSAVRNKVTPINRRTAAQSAVRAVFTGLSQGWRLLTDAQRSGWNAAAAAGFTVTNIFGDIVHKTGINLYISLNQNLTNVGITQISDVPSTSDSPALMTAIAPTSDVSSTNMFVDAALPGGSTLPADNAMVVYATPRMSAGVSFVRSQLRIIQVLPTATDTATANIRAAYIERFGTPAVGDNIVIAAQVINTVSGIAGTPIQARVVITA